MGKHVDTLEQEWSKHIATLAGQDITLERADDSTAQGGNTCWGRLHVDHCAMKPSSNGNRDWEIVLVTPRENVQISASNPWRIKEIHTN